MYRDRRVGVVIPAYNEERLISKTLETLPDFVDRVVVIDDGSEDATAEKVRGSIQGDSRIEILQSDLNEGVGAAAHGGARPDVAALYGAQFTNPGYGLWVSGVPAGFYRLVVYARSMITGIWQDSQVVVRVQ